MKVIYENKVKAEGACVHDFEEEKILIIFGDAAPEELADYCYTVSVNPINGEIKPGQTFKVDDLSLKITAVGWEAPETLKGLGHCTFKFNGASEPDQPGTICVEDHDLPAVKVGSVIQILE
ncbi:MAG: PTS glucitol/sorbitol transporter subunit IIA [Oscillibacter sp.]|nr:PTS glucitol/sorbitol transporter subunit IIA [Oscillibacter sp.]MBQ7681049.1 PTS glucitol/sorbitol transporter subunit IIA [Oscillibacter sp.]MBQ9617737.1 PTS glucitol/sorbitol transporter subunit IIA [Oscillibacter sp.]